MEKRYIVVRNQFEGFHYYPGASQVDPRISFLEDRHRHLFKVKVKIEVFHGDRELEFFLVKWAIASFITSSEMNNKSCETIAEDILDFVQLQYGSNREVEVTVSEDGESDGIVHYVP